MMKKYIPHIFIAILFIAIVIQCTNQVSLIEKVATEKEKVKGLQKEITGLHSNVETLNGEKNNLNLKIEELNVEIAKSKKEILIIRKQRDEKINSVNNFTPGQLQQFFTDRYNNIK